MRVCPRCRRANPDAAAFCHHDGIALLMNGAGGAVRALDWSFPSGRRCATLDELATGLLAEWDAGRDALQSGQLRQHLEERGRTDLVKLVESAAGEFDAEIGLQSFIESLPGAAGRPVADPVPRRLNADEVKRTEVRLMPLRIVNRGPGYLHGTISVVEGERWLWLGDGVSPAHTCWLGTRGEQAFTVQIDPTMLPTVGSYFGRIRVESNGGNLEIPVQANLVNRADAFMGHIVRNEKELARLLRDRPREAIGWLRQGQLHSWYLENGLNFPLKGEVVPDMAGVQQFFEAAGFARVPALRLDEDTILAVCMYPESVTRSVTLRTAERKWVYAFVESDSMWIKPVDSVVTGPQAAEIRFEIDSGLLEAGRVHEGYVRLTANGGQAMLVYIRADVRRPNEPFTRRLLRPFLNG